VLRAGDDDIKKVMATSSAEVTFELADADGDGIVTREEQVNFIRRRPSLGIKGLGSLSPILGTTRDGAHAAAAVEAPSWSQLNRLILRAAVPYIGFGFLDNFIMIVAGDSIDHAFGAALGLSSMAAAGLGNLLSDVSGVQAGSVIERWAARSGLPEPGLTREQMEGVAAQRSTSVGSMLGIAIGCILGMAPLLVMEDEAARACRRTFDEIDIDRSGSVSFGELENALHGMGIEFTRKGLARVYAEIDDDRDRQLSFDEFREMCERWKRDESDAESR